MKFNLFSTAAALIAAAALTWLVLRFFFGEQKAASGAMDVSGKRQTATITVKGGYSPAVVSMRAGTPITLTFDRQETGECTSHVVFGDLGLDAMLPGNAVTDVELPALPAGEYPFACGMNMVHGLLKVEGNASAGTDKLHPLTASAEAPMVDSAEAERREAAERTKEITSLTRLVAIGTVLTLPVFIVTMLHMANPMLVPHWMVNPWLQAILITPVMFYCGHPIHAVGFPALAHRSPDMNSLVSLGTSAAYLYSLVTCVAPQVFPEGSREPYFESVGVVITLVLVGRLLETKAREGTGKAVQSLIKLRPRTAHKLNAASPENVEWLNPANFTDMDIDTIAAGVLYPFTGWLLSPMIAGLAMALSSVCLVLNANRLHAANISGGTTTDITGSAAATTTANTIEPTVIVDDRTSLNHVTDQSNNPTNKENTMDMGMHMHHNAPADGETATDPVCGMTVAVNDDAITREYEGKSYYFCGEHCATNFAKAPQIFLS